jgi:hypothetical protein
MTDKTRSDRDRIIGIIRREIEHSQEVRASVALAREKASRAFIRDGRLE